LGHDRVIERVEDQGGDLKEVTQKHVLLGGIQRTGRVKRFTKTNLHIRKQRAGVIRQVVVFDRLFSTQRSVKVRVQIEQGLALRWPAAHMSQGPSNAQQHAKEETRTSVYRDDVLVDQLCMTPKDLVVADEA
jgi:hypothetical protein